MSTLRPLFVPYSRYRARVRAQEDFLVGQETSVHPGLPRLALPSCFSAAIILFAGQSVTAPEAEEKETRERG
jgi:hypothetical protein